MILNYFLTLTESALQDFFAASEWSEQEVAHDFLLSHDLPSVPQQFDLQPSPVQHFSSQSQFLHLHDAHLHFSFVVVKD